MFAAKAVGVSCFHMLLTRQNIYIYIYIEQLYIYTREKHVDKLFNNRKLFK